MGKREYWEEKRGREEEKKRKRKRNQGLSNTLAVLFFGFTTKAISGELKLFF